MHPAKRIEPPKGEPESFKEEDDIMIESPL